MLEEAVQNQHALSILCELVKPTVSDTSYLKAYFKALDAWKDLQSEVLLHEA